MNSSPNISLLPPCGIFILAAPSLLALFALTDSLGAAEPTTSVGFDRPATSFHQALPLGNGRIGGMVYGGVDEERIVLNESSVWSGSRHVAAEELETHQVLV